ncbi:hypothetical protein BDF19DRAFT_453267 [Syncephalis fuscata]|nr:hypothetical protein BDF19DRAFT_453267 [Syncephalis fuscata]
MLRFYTLSCTIAAVAVLAAITIIHHLPTTDATLPNIPLENTALVASSTSETADTNPFDKWSLGKLSGTQLKSMKTLDSALDVVIHQLSATPPSVNDARNGIATLRKTNWAFHIPNGIKVNTRLEQAANFLDASDQGFTYTLSQLNGLSHDFVKPSINMSTSSQA